MCTNSWDAALGDHLPRKMKPGNHKGPFAMAVLRSLVTIGQFEFWELGIKITSLIFSVQDKSMKPWK